MNHVKSVLFAATVALGSVTTVATVHAQPEESEAVKKERARGYYAQGRKDYDLGNFDKAVENFKKAYDAWDDGAFLFNIAQSYRQLGDCKNALFFYKGFLSRKKDAKEEVKKEVEGHIKVLDECVKNQDAIRNRAPDGTNPPEGLDTSGNTTGTTPPGGTGAPGGTGDDRIADNGGGPGDGDDTDDPEDPDIVETTGQPKLLALHASAGLAKVSAADIPIPMQLAVTITAGYPLPLNDKLVLDFGAGFAFTPVPWSNETADGSATMIGMFANAGGTFEVAPKISLRGELGGGVMLLGGATEEGNPFTPPGMTATGTLLMPLFRIGVSGEYAITKNLSAAVTPIAFSYSPPKDGMKEEIKSLTRLEFTAGIGYRM
jgi:hypothetical protein